MAAFVEVTLLRVNCADMETSSAEHDVFALSGAVVADGKTHPFAEPATPLKTGRTFSYHHKIFSGWVESGAIGIGAIGFDIERSRACRSRTGTTRSSSRSRGRRPTRRSARPRP